MGAFSLKYGPLASAGVADLFVFPVVVASSPLSVALAINGLHRVIQHLPIGFICGDLFPHSRIINNMIWGREVAARCSQVISRRRF